MSDILTHTFPADGPISLSVGQRSGDVVVTAADTAEIVVELRPAGHDGDDLARRTRVEHRPGALRIEVPRTTSLLGRSASVDVAVTVPAGSTVDAQAASGDIRLDGRFADVTGKCGSGDVAVDTCDDVRVSTGSGDVYVTECAGASVRTGSGSIRLGTAAGGVDLESGSGDIEVEQPVRDGRISAASGDVRVATVEGRVEVKTASGDITAHRALEGELRARTASGDVSVGIVAGTAANLDVSSISGSIHSELDRADAPAATDRTLLLSVSTVSGAIRLHRTT
ncbi:DUF4097 family beta strand repeat-containing protein [Jiangella rhizosphaerae]|uniref:DUF4097 domain-containing protein n=1 Tax=Jiangella rhizosphaerae TaxID=2293569 RepID=A0A418KXN6_9ACTN|nr:DUF4097 family beta strand repeat-containing protein [Jiangella rhizosphaerae]RIQ35942.1 hypothetical protein DY240_02240 [Jiangella rhizosphaerae]